MKKIYQNDFSVAVPVAVRPWLLLAIVLFVILPIVPRISSGSTWSANTSPTPSSAVGLVSALGQDSGVLSLGQGIFFGLGGYCMAMYFKARGIRPRREHQDSVHAWHSGFHGLEPGDASSRWFWVPFRNICPLRCSPWSLVPTIVAFIVGAAMFKRRVGGVYFRGHHSGAWR